jgi:hypothetical protein
MHVLTTLLLATLALGEGTPGDLFSILLADASDIDGDGTPDVMVSDPVDADRNVGAGRVWLLSGADTSVLRTWRGHDGEMLGTTLGSTGDVDGDGIPDLLVGEATQRHHGWLGEARYCSTKTGRILGSITRATLEQAEKK